MSNTITGHEYPLYKIFHQDFDLHIPIYQRPYAWTETEASELFEDLYDSFRDNEDYFLGSIVLIKPDDNKAYADLVDGQQRITTLTILFAALANEVDGQAREEFRRLIMEPGSITLDLDANPRLTSREADKDFFLKYVQELRFDSLACLQKEQIKTEAQKHIQRNAVLLRKKIQEVFHYDKSQIVQFGKHIIKNCYIVTVTSSTPKTAFRVFSVLNNRGLDLLPCDIIKAEIIGEIGENNASRGQLYTEKWESIENQTGRDRFNELFGYIRMIFSRKKQQKTLLEEFKTYVFDSFKSRPEELIDDILQPYAEAFRIITKCAYESSADAQAVNKYLFWLNKIDNTDWLPPAILFFSQHHPQKDVELFVKKLERLAATMHICSENVNHRIDRYATVIEEINKNEWPASIELKADEIKTMISKLEGEVFSELTSVRRNYLVLRLDSFVSDGSVQYYSPATLTIEHVLPQTVNPNSQWATWWPNEEERNQWVHRIANLVPLSRQKNSEAYNYDFSLKKSKYFISKNQTSPYVLTTQVLSQQEWTPAVLESRQKMLLEVFKKNWELNT